MKIVKPNYEHSSLNLINSVLKRFNVNNNYPELKSEKLLKSLETSKNIVVILLDGLGNNYLENNIKKGIFHENKIDVISSVFPSTTVAAISSIQSGAPPLVHGLLGWTLYFSEVNRTIITFRNQYVGHDEPVDIDYRKIMEYETIYEKISKASNANTFYITPTLVTDEMKGAKTLKYKSLKKGFMMLNQEINNDKENFAFFYSDEPDHDIHERGTKSFIVKGKVKRYQRIIKKAFSDAPNDTTFIITADHGLTNIKDYIYLYDDKEIYRMLKRRISVESRACAFFIKDKYLEEFPKVFNKKYGEHFILKTKEEILKENFFGFGKEHEKVSSFLGDFFAIAIGEYCISYQGKTKNKIFKASHAGLTEDEMLVPLIVLKK